MFPSSGYFRAVSCPFFASGLCERPHCHFRHSKPPEEKSKDAGPSYSTCVKPYSPAQTNTFTSSSYLQSSLGFTESYSTVDSPSSANSGIESYSTRESSSSSSLSSGIDVHAIPSFSEKQVKLPKPDVEEVDHTVLPKISGLAKRRKTSLPTYNPTPKSQTSHGNIPEYCPTPKTSRSQRSSEYDPVKNYSFWPNSTDGEKEKNNHVNDEDGQESTTIATFSDDESDERDTDSNKDDSMDPRSELGDISNKEKKTQSSDMLKTYEELLTPSSYFTAKLSGLSEKHSSSSSSSRDNKGNISSVDSDSSNKSKPSGEDSQEKSKLRHAKRSECHRQDRHSHSSKESGKHFDSLSHGKKSSSSSSVLSSSSSSPSSSKSHSETIKNSHTLKSSSHKAHSASPHDKQSKKSSVNHDHSRSKSEHTDSSSSSHKDKHRSSSSHKEKHSSSHNSKNKSSSNKDQHYSSSNKEQHNSSSNKEQHYSSSNKEQHNSSSNKEEQNSPSHNKERHGSCSSHKKKVLSKCASVDSSGKKSSSSSSNHSHHEKLSKSAKDSFKSSSTTSKYSSSMSEESKHRKSLSDKIQNESVSKHSSKDVKPDIRRLSDSKKSGNNITSHEKRTDKNILKDSDYLKSKSYQRQSSEKSVLSVKKERRDNKKMLNGKRRHSMMNETCRDSSNAKKSLSSNCIVRNEPKQKLESMNSSSKINSSLFGEDSAGSDSDCQIVQPSPEPPPVVYELSDSDEDLGPVLGLSQEADGEDKDYSDSDTFDECLRIFQESERQLKLKSIKLENDRKPEQGKAQAQHSSDSSDIDLIPEFPGKKRMAHKAADQITRPIKRPTFSRPRLSPAEVMHNRIVEIQKKALLRAAQREGRESDLPKEIKSSLKNSSNLSLSAVSLISNQKKREAHSPMTPTKTLSNTGKTSSAAFSPNSFYTKNRTSLTSSAVTSSSSSRTPASGQKLVTIATTASKTEKRKAHTPTQLNLKRPVLPVEFNAKVATNIRQRYLNLIIDEYQKFCSEEEAITKGKEEEEAVYKRATNKNIYLHVAVSAIKKIRAQAAEALPSSSKKPRSSYSLSSAASLSSHVSQSHEATLAGAGALRTTFTLNRSRKTGVKLPTEFKGEELYKRLKGFILTEEQLRENGFPRPADDKSKAVFYKEHEADKLLKDNERICRRCGIRYMVDDNGTHTYPEQCIYHYGKAYKKKVAGSIDSRYACCNERAGVKGCQVAKTHVNERNKFINLTGYMKTLPATDSDPRNHKVLSLDCEMVYTKAGLELARLTVIGEDCNVVFESLVKPDSAIIDYNTRFSGITEKDMCGVTTSLRDIQAIMLTIASDKTILMGHSLESDLTALQIIHNTVVDTSIVFPHRLGLPYKRALKNLMIDHLQKIIQADDGGHDSKEDALACMQLMKYKVKEEAKREYRCN